MSNIENTLLLNKHYLIVPINVYKSDVDKSDVNKSDIDKSDPQKNSKFKYMENNFCGKVLNFEEFEKIENLDEDVNIYFCGDISKIYDISNKYTNNKIYIIHEFLCRDNINGINGVNDYMGDYITLNKNNKNIKFINSGQVPINIHNVGVYFRDFFDSDNKDYYESIENEHKFQKLTESNKQGKAFRKGIYLSNVNKDDNKDNIRFNLLRCSSNLDGPTDNFRETDKEILKSVNEINNDFFSEKVELNHVLAQIYQDAKPSWLYVYFMIFVNYFWQLIFKLNYFNMKNTEKKAKIKAHSDKTKDMPGCATMAFCTFYKSYKYNKFNEPEKQIKKSKLDKFDYVYKDCSVLTQLHFKLKPTVEDKTLVKDFCITLYPNSVFLMSLNTNRLYTHDIRPSPLSIDKIPTRMGYVIRCSNTEAVFKNGSTYILNGDKEIKLEKPTAYDILKVKELYFTENTTTDKVSYDNIYFSLNDGDYLKPIL